MSMNPSDLEITSSFAPSGNAKIYYEIAGAGQPLVMIHAGVADSRQWNNEFAHFVQSFRVVRYDQRGFGQSEPVDGDFTHLGDLTALLNHLEIREPIILMGCSMGGGLALNFALTNPSRVKALIMVDSGPTGLQLDVPDSPKFKLVEQAFDAGDLDLTAELETQIWFDGEGRTPEQVDKPMRKLVYEMNRLALVHEVKNLGKRLPDTEVPAAERLAELKIPTLIIVGEHDTPFSLAAADYMLERIVSARKELIKNAAHLPNMDSPEKFQDVVGTFLDDMLSRNHKSPIMRTSVPQKIQAIVDALLTGPAVSDSDLRKNAEAYAAALNGATRKIQNIPAELEEYIEKVALHAHQVAGADIERLKSLGYPEEVIFEITLCASVGAGLARWERGLQAMQDGL